MDEKWNISFLAEKEGDRNDRKVVMRVSWGENLSRQPCRLPGGLHPAENVPS